MELLNKVGSKDKASLFSEQVPGGKQQRAAIARALAMKPKIILYDEPTSSLDPTLADEVLAVLKELHSEGITQFQSTLLHNLRTAGRSRKRNSGPYA